MRSDVTTRVQKHRAMLRNSGMRPIQIWIPDTRSERFVEECHRQAILAAKADLEDVEQASLLDAIMCSGSHLKTVGLAISAVSSSD